jgi:hypothetical protein
MAAQTSVLAVSALITRQLSLESASDNVSAAQDRYSKAVRESGAGSQEAQDALKQLERAQKSLQTTQSTTTLMTAAMGFQFVGLAGNIVYSLPKIRDLINTLKSLNIVASITQALQGPKGWINISCRCSHGRRSSIYRISNAEYFQQHSQHKR